MTGVNAFVSGGYVPEKVRGSKLNGMIHIADWYGTLCSIAGVSSYDAEAAQSNLPPVDSVNVWPMLSGKNMTSPRQTILVNEKLLVHNQWKYVPHGTTMIESAAGGPVYPNATTDATNDWIDSHNYHCTQPNGCLWNVVKDISETNECSSEYPSIVKMMKTIMKKEIATIWSTSHTNSLQCKTTAMGTYNGFYGPWKEL